MDNYTTLQRNTLAGLSETAGNLYLQLFDQYEGHKSRANERRAFLAACDYDYRCGAVLDYILRHGPLGPSGVINAETRENLSRFFSGRWRHNFTPATTQGESE